jgi:hypothetical protein
MRASLAKVVAIAAMASSAPLAVSAATADFTSNAFTDLTEVIDGRTVTLTASDTITFQAFDGPGGAAGNAYCSAAGGDLACIRDGAGVRDGDDEVTGHAETLTVTFSDIVEITGIRLLDFFRNAGGAAEVAFVNGGNILNTVDFTANMLGPDANTMGGYFVGSGFVPRLIVTSLIFTAPGIAGDDGINDYALAAIDFTAVPLPASALLLLGSLGGFAWLRRRAAA